MDFQKCPVCAFPARVHDTDLRGDDTSVDCVRCGPFRLIEDMDYWIRQSNFLPQQIAALSYYIRRNAGLTIGRASLPTLKALPLPTVPEKMARLLMQLSKNLPIPGEVVESPVWAAHRLAGKIGAASSGSTFGEDTFTAEELGAAEYLGHAGLSDAVEFRWMVLECLMAQRLVSEGGVNGGLQITPLGWQEVARLQEVNTASRIGFVEMSFHSNFLDLYDLALAPGIVAAGYEPVRVDRREHNNRIDDEIIALVKRSRFLVADFSGNRGGIYFEAGLAIGLGLPVIWTVREDRIERIHFDTRQFNHIRWTADHLPAFAKAVQNRIEATIGRGSSKLDENLTQSHLSGGSST